MKFGQLIEDNKKIFFFKNHAASEAGGLVPDLFLIFKTVLQKLKAIALQLTFNIFRQRSTWNTIKKNCVKLQTMYPETCSILIFQKRIWEQFLHHILCMNFQEKCFSCYVLFTDQISSPDCIYFFKYWAVCILQLFASQFVTLQILKLALSS